MNSRGMQQFYLLSKHFTHDDCTKVVNFNRNVIANTMIYPVPKHLSDFQRLYKPKYLKIDIGL